MPTNNDSPTIDTDDLRPEYELDFSRSRSNRFASELSATVVAVTLEPDVAAVFGTSESVNRALRSVLSAQPTAKRAGRLAGRLHKC